MITLAYKVLTAEQWTALKAGTFEGAPIDVQRNYAYVVERGPQRVDAASPDDPRPLLSGRALLDIQRDEYADAGTALQARTLMRYVINHHLGGKELHTRLLLREMHQL